MDGPEQPEEHFSVQSLSHHSLQPLGYRAETAMGYLPSDVQRQQHQ
jgi:hypothetical protein